MTNNVLRTICLFSALLFAQQLQCLMAWSAPNPFSSLFGSPNNNSRGMVVVRSTFPSGEEADNTVAGADDPERRFVTRRALLGAAALNIGLIGAAPMVVLAAADAPAAAATTSGATTTAATVYKSGKTPIVPGQKPRDKGDVRGTRKDPDFLRSIADCRSQCQNSVGSDGYARAKEDCLSECQDICCKTYEQCTFDIVPRI